MIIKRDVSEGERYPSDYLISFGKRQFDGGWYIRFNPKIKFMREYIDYMTLDKITGLCFPSLILVYRHPDPIFKRDTGFLSKYFIWVPVEK